MANTRLAALATLLSSYDIVALQELYGSWTSQRDDFIRLARAHGFTYSLASSQPPWSSFFLCDGGLVIISRHPIDAADELTYRRGVGADAYAAKGALYARVAGIHLFTTHLQSSYATGVSGTQEIRRQQLRQLVEFVRRRGPVDNDDASVVVCGDFNVDALAHDGEYQRLVALFQTLGLVDRLQPRLPTYGVDEHYLTVTSDRDSRQSLDYFFATSGQARVETMAAVLPSPLTHISDHYALSLTLD